MKPGEKSVSPVVALFAIAGAFAACVCVCCVWMGTSNDTDIIQNETANDRWYAPDLERMGASYAEVFRTMTIQRAMDHIRRTNPQMKAVMVAPGYNRRAFWNANTGYTAAFRGTSASQPVKHFDIGNNVVWGAFTV
jgi:hypothetical protein